MDLFASASVIANCSIRTTPINFGTYKPKTTANASGSVTVICTKGTQGISISLDKGKNALEGSMRRMKNSSGSYLTYELYKPLNSMPETACDYVAIWGSGINAFDISQAPSRVARTYNICGRIPAIADNAKASVGHYTDIVNATVHFDDG